MNDDTTDEQVYNRRLTPKCPNPLFSARKLKPYNQQKLMYAMTASTNGPHITSGVNCELTPKRGIYNNDRVLHYLDVNLGQDLNNCSAVLFVSILTKKLRIKNNLIIDVHQIF